MAFSTSDPSLKPAMEAPLGLRSNMVDQSSTDYSTIIICVLAIVLSTPFVILRLYTRKFITHQVWWDDWCCLLGWIFEIALIGLLFQVINYGGGIDSWNGSKVDFKHFAKLFHDIEIVARIGMFFTKASIVLFYSRVFLPTGTERSHIWWSIWFVFYWNLLYAIALVLTVVTECVGKADRVARGETCLDQYAVAICASVINVVSDLMILIIPIVAIGRLHMSKEKKIKLSAIFAVGLLGVLASVARLSFQIPEAKKPNQTVIIMIISELNLVEHMIGLIVSSMPSLPAFFKRLRGAAAPSTSVSFEEPTSQRGLKKDSKTNVLRFTRSWKHDRGRGAAAMGLDDSSLLCSSSANSEYKNAGYELIDLEGQKGVQTQREKVEELMGK